LTRGFAPWTTKKPAINTAGKTGGGEMILICAWCKTTIREKAPLGDKSETYSVCRKCSKKLRNQYSLSDALSIDDIETRIKFMNHLKG